MTTIAKTGVDSTVADAEVSTYGSYSRRATSPSQPQCLSGKNLQDLRRKTGDHYIVDPKNCPPGTYPNPKYTGLTQWGTMAQDTRPFLPMNVSQEKLPPAPPTENEAPENNTTGEKPGPATKTKEVPPPPQSWEGVEVSVHIPLSPSHQWSAEAVRKVQGSSKTSISEESAILWLELTLQAMSQTVGITDPNELENRLMDSGDLELWGASHLPEDKGKDTTYTCSGSLFLEK